MWYDIRIEITDGRIKCFLNDELVHNVELPRPTIDVAASKEDATGDIILKIANSLPQHCQTQIRLRGVDAVQPKATLTLLTGDKDDGNDLENPERVTPVVSQISVGTSFDYQIPPCSVQFIRIGKK